MKKRIVFVVFITAIVGSGCPDGSPVVRFMTGMNVQLYYEGDFDPIRFDVWATNGEEDIYGAAFIYVCTLEDNGIPLTGVRVECQIVSHSDPTGVGWDIWDELAPNGEEYGYVQSLPNGSWDGENNVGVAYTNADGRCFFLVGLGDPDTGFDTAENGYRWPDYDDGVSTLVGLRFVIKKASSNITQDCSAMFVRSSYQNFWEPYEGVYGNSFSSLFPVGGASKSFNENSVEIGTDSVLSVELDWEETAPIRKEPFVGMAPDKSGSPDLIVNDPNISGWEYVAGTWRKWYLGEGYDLVDGLIATWITNIDVPSDPNGEIPDPNMLTDASVTLAMDLSEPCIFLCAFDADANDLATVRVWEHTGKVIGVNGEGETVSELPIELFTYQILGNTVYLATNFILPMEFPEQQGKYYDSWGNSYAAIYVPDGGHLEVTKDAFYGDFNFDGKVNHEDYSMFAVRWNSDMFEPYDPNIVYDLMYDADCDGRTGVSDLMCFSDNWLETR